MAVFLSNKLAFAIIIIILIAIVIIIIFITKRGWQCKAGISPKTPATQYQHAINNKKKWKTRYERAACANIKAFPFFQ